MQVKSFQNKSFMKPFWSSIFYVFGFESNPFLNKAKEISKKDIDERIGDAWRRTGENFMETFEKEKCLINEQ